MSACCFRSSMNRCGNRAITDSQKLHTETPRTPRKDLHEVSVPQCLGVS
jgi:hypothetical protein